ncbi:TraR/DksA C4-type zinc finger protein [Bacillus sp. SD075]|uniref:TraR/DksA C4-type zinc finger protein n=1 Tax=Bacillus sp. SD075 TaxID=2781732 RepID=UPI001A9642DC|nr:TraR/DksA C4-type zinc finger protein [Bacillus sp. SD075]MBO0999977.1 TraR/DksA C4-type zinc finger protein [Bacillus sp. SD075]
MATKQQTQKFKNELLQEKNELSNRIQNDEQSVLDKSQTESVGELSSYDNHPGDLGTELFEIERNQALDEHAESEMEKIDDALKALEEGSYGRCKTCNMEIPIERLEVIPSTLHCVEHAPERPLSQDRPAEEDILIPSKGDHFENRHGIEIVDKEDSFGEVAKFGTSETPSDYTGDHGNYNDFYKTEDETNGFPEDYEGFAANDIEGRNRVDMPNKKQKEFKDRLEEENIESNLGSIPYRQKDSYINEKK